MLSPLKNATYRKLFAAQILSLSGTGLATVALGLLAFELAGERAGMVLGTALFIKMVAYVGIAPIAEALADRFARKPFLIALDLFRACIVLALPFVTSVWQIYTLIFVLQAASAAFTPQFQAVIPDILEDEGEYTKALSLSRLAYDFEALLSPLLAAVLLTLISFHWLFGLTALGFVASALLVMRTVLPDIPRAQRAEKFTKRLTRGVRIYLSTPRLRGVLALTFAVASGGAMVLVNTVVLVQGALGRSEYDAALALMVFGAGSMSVTLLLPRLLEVVDIRRFLIFSAGIMTLVLFAFGLLSVVIDLRWSGVLLVWYLIGAGYAAVLTPTGRLLVQSAAKTDRPALFAAQFALSHLCWLVAYPVAGLAGLYLGQTGAMLLLSGFASVGVALAMRVWPANNPDEVRHEHPDLPLDHPHLSGHRVHSHPFIIDDHHTHWPNKE